MASSLATILVFTILTLLPTALPSAQSLAFSDDTGCNARLLLLAPCAPFVQGATPLPPDACCNGLLDVYRDQPHCLCILLDGSTSLPVNQTLALRLPLLCRLPLPAGDNTCPGLSLPPLGSPRSHETGGSSANPSAAASPTVASPPSPRNNNLLNRGGNTRVERGSIAAVVMVLVLARAF